MLNYLILFRNTDKIKVEGGEGPFEIVYSLGSIAVLVSDDHRSLHRTDSSNGHLGQLAEKTSVKTSPSKKHTNPLEKKTRKSHGFSTHSWKPPYDSDDPFRNRLLHRLFLR
ncbi:hypothetical protein TNCT_420851 [Trichonephila clavata]|uniref:Uncharacterized protein n=1 Tax=Trichonephila clavata TaxID=2740835 RepID=A0A8X6GXQ2_TRICU|nr:hypothetical protein TNCT_420851 [Trichonephila clavata]